jgi:hypothetical protein
VEAGRGGGGPTGKHADLIRVWPGVEVAAHHDRVVPPRHLLDEAGELAHLCLAQQAGIEGVVEHSG